MGTPLKILLAVDGSGASLHAVDHVIYLLRGGLRAEVVLAHAQPAPRPLEMLVARSGEAAAAGSQAAGEHLALAAIQRLDAAGVPHVAEVVLTEGDPAHALLDIAAHHGCGLVVVGARRMGVLRQAVMGSVSRTLLQESPVPVTVVRESGHSGEAGRHVERRRSQDNTGGGTGGAGHGGRDDDATGDAGGADGGGGDSGGGGGGGGD